MITWDESKRRVNLTKHGLDFVGAEAIFDEFMLVFEIVSKNVISKNADTDLTDWARVDAMCDDDIDLSDHPEWGEEQFAQSQHRGPHKVPLKQPVSIRLSPEVVEYFKASGPGWQTRLDTRLRE